MSPAIPTVDDLLDIARRHYPRRYEDAPGPELRRFWDAACDAWSDMSRWQSLLARLRSTLPDCWIWDESVHAVGAAWRCRVFPPQLSAHDLPEYHTAVGMVSFLAPVYLVYASHQRRDADGLYLSPTLSYTPSGLIAPYSATLAREIEATFDLAPLPLDIAFTPVPDVFVGNLQQGEARLIDCLFIDART